MSERAHVARINERLWVGNCESCPDFAGSHVVHIYRDDREVAGKPSQERHCVHLRPGRHNLRMNYRDGDELDPTNLQNLDAFLAHFMRRPASDNTLLVHCHAGMCRSPTVAIYALVKLDGMHPIDAQALVTKAIHAQRSGEVCNVVYQPLKQIIRLWEGWQP